MHTGTHTLVQTHTHACTHARTHARTHAHTHARTHTANTTHPHLRVSQLNSLCKVAMALRATQRTFCIVGTLSVRRMTEREDQAGHANTAKRWHTVAGEGRPQINFSLTMYFISKINSYTKVLFQ